MTEWRRIPGWEHYEVSSSGLVRSPKGEMRPWISKGYEMITLQHKGRRWHAAIHRLVALAFFGPPPPGDIEVAHGDGDRRNNAAGNLRYVTPIGNRADCIRHGTQPLGDRSPNTKVPEAAIPLIRSAVASGERQRDVAARFGISQRQVWRIVHHLSRRGFALSRAASEDMLVAPLAVEKATTGGRVPA
jgi:hypothetical protein